MKRSVVSFAVFVVAFTAGGTVLGQEPRYIGDDLCAACHEDYFDDYILSGHPWKIFRTEGDTPGPNTWPWTPVPPLPSAFGTQLQWSDIEYVIGNFFWKARFIDPTGFIWTGNATDSTQWNIATQEFVPYHPDETRPFNCGKCHTTGYDPAGNQDGLPGLVGTWAQDGVRCEACHGPGSEHAGSFGDVPPPGGKDCAECHFRDPEFRMPWKGGFMRHHQQSEDFAHSPHDGLLDCESCHDSHKSVVYQQGGVTTHCSDCHCGNKQNGYYKVAGMEDVDCIDCHMPLMAKSAVALNPYAADVRGHIFRIMTEPIFADENVTGGFWNQDATGQSAITLDYACLGCHIDLPAPHQITIAEAAAFAEDIHNRHPADGGGGCPVRSISEDSPGGLANLGTIYRFRDQVMAGSALGKEYADMYYEHAGEAVKIMALNPRLALQSKALLGQLMPKIRAAVAGGGARLSARDIAVADKVMAQFAAKAGPELQSAISKARSDLQSGRLSTLFAAEAGPAPQTNSRRGRLSSLLNR